MGVVTAAGKGQPQTSSRDENLPMGREMCIFPSDSIWDVASRQRGNRVSEWGDEITVKPSKVGGV